MPTSYTAPVGDGKLNFNQFVWRCARGMGALFSMRDDSLDAKIPEKISTSSYHQDAIDAALKRRAELDDLPWEEVVAALHTSYDEAIKRRAEAEAERLKTKANYEKMLAEVNAWVPPTQDHEGLKRFMIEQLQDSIKWDCSPSSWPEPQLTSAKEWLEEQYASIADDIAYHKRELARETDAVAAVNQWLADLRSSVPQPR